MISKRSQYITGSALALIGSPLSGWIWRIIHPGQAQPNLIFNIINKWVITAFLILWVISVEREPLKAIGLTPMRLRHWFIGAATFVVGGILFSVTAPIVLRLGRSTAIDGIEILSQQPLSMLIPLVITAGITEEILFRGYPIERLGSLMGSRWIAGAIAWLIFTGLHIPFWGLGGALQIGVAAILVTAVYVWTGCLGVVILAHLLNDCFAFIILPRLLLTMG